MKLGELIKVLNACDVVLGEVRPENTRTFKEIFRASTSSPIWESFANREIHSVAVRDDIAGMILVGIKPIKED